ncbi:MAG: MotA/TolQ/ExbB proton channel family protein [Polyangiaceae bacterium]|nr:MotA/TolQ/ExbB proton channel family protein [Polyangiaceae bacterium]
MNIVERMNMLAHLGAGWVLWALVAASVAAVAIVIERAAVLVASRDDLEALRARLRELLQRGEVEPARRLLEESPSFEARVAAAGLGAPDAVAARERIAGESQLVRLTLERRLVYLGTLGNNAPFVGLLGTVIGIIRAFGELETSGGQVSTRLMGEIGEALVATAVGLLVALPAVAAFNLLQRVVRTRLARAEALAHEVVAGAPATVATEAR